MPHLCVSCSRESSEETLWARPGWGCVLVLRDLTLVVFAVWQILHMTSLSNSRQWVQVCGGGGAPGRGLG